MSAQTPEDVIAGKLFSHGSLHGHGKITDQEMAAIIRAALRAAGYAVADKAPLQIALAVLCAARDAHSWHGNFVKDFDCAIDGLRAMLAAATPPPSPPTHTEA